MCVARLCAPIQIEKKVIGIVCAPRVVAVGGAADPERAT